MDEGVAAGSTTSSPGQFPLGPMPPACGRAHAGAPDGVGATGRAPCAGGGTTLFATGRPFVSLLPPTLGKFAERAALTGAGCRVAAAAGAVVWCPAPAALAHRPTPRPGRAADREVTVPG